MNLPARTIWDTRIQCVCGVIAARHAGETEIYMSGNFGQATFDPPRIVINPNRLYPIEGMIRRARRFSVNVMGAEDREDVLKLVRMRRRQPRKAEALGWQLEEKEGIPYLPGAAQVLFCELEKALDTGDHTVMIARVLEIRNEERRARALLYQEVAGDAPAFPRLEKLVRRLVVGSPLGDVLKSARSRLRPPARPDLGRNTYNLGGQTEEELEKILSHGVVDRGRILKPGGIAPRVRKPVGICVVGTHWGSFHCGLARAASREARLFVCGQDKARTERLARSVGAEDYFIGIESAAADSRVEALSLALPHHLHRQAAEIALGRGKHVLVEKPIATTLADADAMIAAASGAGRILMVAEDMHFRPSVAFVARRIELGDIGEPLHMVVRCGGVRRPGGWAADRDKLGGGVFMDIGVHFVRAMRLLMGEPDSAFASRPMQVNTKMSGEDSLNVLFESRYGWQSHLFATWAHPWGAGPDIVVAGEKGTFHLWPDRSYVEFYPVAARLLTKLVGYVRPFRLQERLMRPGLQRVRMRIPGPKASGYVAEFREFLSAVSEGRQPVTPAADGRRDLEIVLRAYDSLASGQRVEINAV